MAGSFSDNDSAVPGTSDFQAFERTWRFRRMMDRALRWLRSCARCGSIQPPIDIFCPKCQAMLMEQQNIGRQLLQTGYRFPVYALFTWTESNDSVIRPFVYAFKRGYCVGSARELVHRMVYEMGCEVPLAPHMVYPLARLGAGPDHAWLLARSFAESTGSIDLPMIGLKPAGAGSQSQKAKSASQRRDRRFQSEKNFSSQGRNWVFIDDVITTGSTAAAALRALGDRERFEAWALVCRPKLAKFDGFC